MLDAAFGDCSSLTNIIIPNSVISIGILAFSGCSGLRSITIPDSVTSIGEGAFYYCSSLTNITISDSVTYIGARAFYGTAYYNNEDKWVNGVLYINNQLIEAEDSLLGAYTIRKGTKCIAAGAFKDCSSLTSVTISDGIVKIGEYAFGYCSSLTDIYFEGAKARWLSIDKGDEWDYNIGDYTVHCSDGDIEK